LITFQERLLKYFEVELPNHYNSETIRQSQVQMALDVLDFLQPENLKKYLIIEAPVGTGKSLGALIPAAICGKEYKKKIVYATATINLQGQLMNVEVPLLKKFKLIKQPIYAKGKAHYFCLNELQNLDSNSRNYNYKDIIAFKDSFYKFYRETDTGHRNEFEKSYGAISDNLWEYVSLSKSKIDCQHCNNRYTCPSFFHRSRFKGRHVDLIITNHDQLIRSVLNKISDPPQDPIIPINPGIIIIDEAHAFQENFLGQSEKSLSISKIISIIRKLPHSKRHIAISVARKIEIIVKSNIKELDSFQGRYPIPESIEKLLGEMTDIIKDSIIELQAKGPYSLYERRNLTNEIVEKLEVLQLTLIQLTNDSENVSWINYEQQTFYSITRKFSKDFKSLLQYFAYYNKVIIMSGTLTVDGDFSNMLKQWRLRQEEVSVKSLPSSFSYKEQAIMYVPKHLIDFKEEHYGDNFISNQVEYIKQLLEITNGSSLILVTSKSYLDQLYELIKPFLEEKKINFYKQGHSSVEQLTSTFKADETSVLIGSGSYFSGFSVQGTSLISVIITKLPFPVEDDPYLKLIGEGYEDDMFNVIYFPYMMIKLNQAVGRLIRDIKDYGAVTILDSRVFKASYGCKIQGYFEKTGYIITQNNNEIEEFFRNKRAGKFEISYPIYNRDHLILYNSLLKEMNEEITSQNHIALINENSKVKLDTKPIKRKRKAEIKKYYLSDEELEKYRK
jgi:ATP-dependent DNA helicase DinG